MSAASPISWLTLSLILFTGIQETFGLSVIAEQWRKKTRGSPVISVYEFQPTRAKGEVWAMCDAGHGQIWVGSDELYLLSKGRRKSIPLPTSTYAVRALARDAEDRVWVGSIGEIGYLERTPAGDWKYHSMQPELEAAGIHDLLDIWSVHSTRHGIVFLESSRILRWNGQQFQSWNLQGPQPRFATKDHDTLWILQQELGILRMEAAGPELVFEADSLPDTHPLWILSANESTLLGAVNGIFRFTNNQWKKLPNLSRITKGALPAQVSRIDFETIAIGSYHKGVVVATVHDEILAHINTESGLPNDSVMGMWFDGKTHLWVGLQEALASIEITGETSIFGPSNNLKHLPVLRVAHHEDNTYVLSKVELLRINRPESPESPPTLETVLQPSSLFSDIHTEPGIMWVSESTGVIHEFRHGNNPRLLFPDSSDFDFSFMRSSHPDMPIVYASGTSIGFIRLVSESKYEKSLALSLPTYILSIAAQSPSDIWVSTYTQGIFRYHIHPSTNPPRTQFVSSHVLEAQSPAQSSRTLLSTVGDSLFALSGNSVHTFDTELGRFRKDLRWANLSATAATTAPDGLLAYWTVTSNQLSSPTEHSVMMLLELIADESTGKLQSNLLEIPGVEKIGHINTIDLTHEQGQRVLWLSGNRGTLRFVPAAKADYSHEPTSVRISRILENAQPVPLHKGNPVRALHSNTHTLEFELEGIDPLGRTPQTYQYRIPKLTTQWSLATIEPSIRFTGLSPGRYDLEIQIIDILGNPKTNLSSSFYIHPPWFQTIWAYALYLSILSGGIIGIIKWKLHHTRRLNLHLNRLVQERTQELAKASAAKNEFIECISHEIRNPLNGISNLVDLLSDANLSQDIRKLASSLKRSTSHLNEVFSEILGYAQLEYGHILSTQSPFRLIPLIEDIRILFEKPARETGTELSISIPNPFEDGFSGDAEKIRSILVNYLGNAIKYAPGQPIQVLIKTQPARSAHKQRLRISVCDRGNGVSPSDQELLFTKFGRGTAVKQQGIPGTGLGLATCKAIADLLPAKVGYRDHPDGGACFWLEVELAKAQVSSPPTEDCTLEGNALIVDDQEYNQAVLCGIVGSLGYQCDCTASVKQALILANHRAFSVVFLDWELPDGTGDQVARQLRKKPLNSKTIIIATTAHNSEEVRDQCRLAGMDGFALKPFNREQLRSIIFQTLRQRELAESEQERPFLISTEPTPEGLSLQVFHDFSLGNPERAAQAVSLYLTTLEHELQQLREHIKAENPEAVAAQAHRIRSHAALINDVRLNTAANDLVMAARGQSSSPWRKCCEAVFQAAADLEGAIRNAGISDKSKLP